MSEPGVRTAPERILKTTFETLYVPMEFASANFAPGETITALGPPVVTGPDSSLVADQPSFSGTEAQVRLVGGTVGATYQVILRATTSRGQLIEGRGDAHVDAP